MNAHRQRLFVVTAVEDTNAPAFVQTLETAPHKVMVEIFTGGPLKGKDLASLRVDPGHDMLDGAILAGSVHRLEDEQYCPLVLRVEHVLQIGQRLDAGSQRLLGARLVL